MCGHNATNMHVILEKGQVIKVKKLPRLLPFFIIIKMSDQATKPLTIITNEMTTATPC